jgi:hypothetical protein
VKGRWKIDEEKQTSWKIRRKIAWKIGWKMQVVDLAASFAIFLAIFRLGFRLSSICLSVFSSSFLYSGQFSRYIYMGTHTCTPINENDSQLGAHFQTF